MKVIYEKPKVFTDSVTTYCGGCGHGIVGKLIGELIDEMGLQDNGIMVWPIGCSCLSDRYYNMDMMMALHGRAPAAATGIKRADPSKFVMVYQGCLLYTSTPCCRTATPFSWASATRAC